jgi:hypothetical protein
LELRLAQLFLAPNLALVAAQALALPAIPAAVAPTAPTAPTVVAAAPAPQGAAGAPAAITVTATRFAAAGSVFHVADGVVVHAAYARVVPPAPGFVYER